VSIQDTPEAFFTVDGDHLVPGPMAQGPWGATVSGHIVGGLLGWAVEHAGGDPELQPARLTVDLLRPTFMEPVRVETSVLREGKRIKVVDAVLHQGDHVVSRASAVFLRRGEHPAGDVWTSPMAMPPLPGDAEASIHAMPFELWAYGVDTQSGSLGGTGIEWEQNHSRKFAWVREIRPLIEGEAMTPFTRVALAGDVTSALTHWGTGGLRYINADFTLTLSRQPDGEFIGLASDGHQGSGGVASGAATLFDQHGPIGSSIAVALAQPAEAFRPPRHIGLR
jgi:acyl-coenzyme A thioesterase PaaI-like protein